MLCAIAKSFFDWSARLPQHLGVCKKVKTAERPFWILFVMICHAFNSQHTTPWPVSTWFLDQPFGEALGQAVKLDKPACWRYRMSGYRETVSTMKDGSPLRVLLCKVAPGCTCWPTRSSTTTWDQREQRLEVQHGATATSWRWLEDVACDRQWAPAFQFRICWHFWFWPKSEFTGGHQMSQRSFCRKKVSNPRSYFLAFGPLGCNQLNCVQHEAGFCVAIWKNSGEDAPGRQKQKKKFNAANCCGWVRV